MLGPLGDGIREVLADHTLKGLAVLGSVEVTEDVIKERFSKRTTTMWSIAWLQSVGKWVLLCS